MQYAELSRGMGYYEAKADVEYIERDYKPGGIKNRIFGTTSKVVAEHYMNKYLGKTESR